MEFQQCKCAKKKLEVILSLLRLLVILSISSKIFLRRKSLQNSTRSLFFLPDTEFCEPNGLLFSITYSGSKRIMTASVTSLLKSMRSGENATEAANDLVKYFLPMLRSRLACSAKSLRISDEDDIALEAFYEFCVAIEKNHFEDIADRTQLWHVLSMIAVRKANDHRKREQAHKRGGTSQVLPLNSFREQLASLDANPELHMDLLEQCDLLLRQLNSTELRNVAELKLHGYTNSEIANKLKVSRRTIQYMMAKIKTVFLAVGSEDQIED